MRGAFVLVVGMTLGGVSSCATTTPVTSSDQVSSSQRDSPQVFYCATLLSNPASGACYTTMNACTRFRDTPGIRDTTGECVPRKTSVCFDVIWDDNGKRTTFCEVSLEACESFRNDLRQLRKGDSSSCHLLSTSAGISMEMPADPTPTEDNQARFAERFCTSDVDQSGLYELELTSTPARIDLHTPQCTGFPTGTKMTWRYRISHGLSDASITVKNLDHSDAIFRNVQLNRTLVASCRERGYKPIVMGVTWDEFHPASPEMRAMGRSWRLVVVASQGNGDDKKLDVNMLLTDRSDAVICYVHFD